MIYFLRSESCSGLVHMFYVEHDSGREIQMPRRAADASSLSLWSLIKTWARYLRHVFGVNCTTRTQGIQKSFTSASTVATS